MGGGASGTGERSKEEIRKRWGSWDSSQHAKKQLLQDETRGRRKGAGPDPKRAQPGVQNRIYQDTEYLPRNVCGVFKAPIL